jgi:hypothetical protein
LRRINVQHFSAHASLFAVQSFGPVRSFLHDYNEARETSLRSG